MLHSGWSFEQLHVVELAVLCKFEVSSSKSKAPTFFHDREKRSEPSILTMTLQIYKVLLAQQHVIAQMTSQNATLKDVGELIAKHCKIGGMTYSEYFKKNPYSGARE